MVKWLLNKQVYATPLSAGGLVKRALVLLLGVVLLYQIWVFLHICWWIKFNPSSSAFMEDRLAIIQEAKPEAELKHQWVDYQKISNHLKRAVIASEDAKFTDHEGVDWEAIQKAYEKNLKKGKIVSGGSTISQQLAKNLFLSSKRTPWRKAQELVITYMLEAMLSKQRIFEIYLNVIEWGNGVFGAQAAARYYYKTNAANLSSNQAARLAAMIPNPRFYDAHRNTRYLAKRTATIQARMEYAEIP
ncbi:MAG: monofunctional biosynthetic peptidoglycan transglycosylase [Methylotenera sp.]|nr:monofunctional biosynthetic peptidoglycan transglycosylase [Methylotenera sp.]